MDAVGFIVFAGLLTLAQSSKSETIITTTSELDHLNRYPRYSYFWSWEYYCTDKCRANGKPFGRLVGIVCDCFCPLLADNVDGCSKGAKISCSLICARSGYKTGACIYQDKCYCFCRPHQWYDPAAAGILPMNVENFETTELTEFQSESEVTEEDTEENTTTGHFGISISGNFAILQRPIKLDNQSEIAFELMYSNETETDEKYLENNIGNLTQDEDVSLQFNNSLDNVKVGLANMSNETDVLEITSDFNSYGNFSTFENEIFENLEFDNNMFNDTLLNDTLSEYIDKNGASLDDDNNNNENVVVELDDIFLDSQNGIANLEMNSIGFEELLNFSQSQHQQLSAFSPSNILTPEELVIDNKYFVENSTAKLEIEPEIENHVRNLTSSQKQPSEDELSLFSRILLSFFRFLRRYFSR